MPTVPTLSGMEKAHHGYLPSSLQSLMSGQLSVYWQENLDSLTLIKSFLKIYVQQNPLSHTSNKPPPLCTFCCKLHFRSSLATFVQSHLMTSINLLIYFDCLFTFTHLILNLDP